jgi:hypothetical protein
MSEKKHPTFEYIGPAGLKVMADLRTRLEEAEKERTEYLSDNLTLRKTVDKVREIVFNSGTDIDGCERIMKLRKLLKDRKILNE